MTQYHKLVFLNQIQHLQGLPKIKVASEAKECEKYCQNTYLTENINALGQELLCLEWIPPSRYSEVKRGKYLEKKNYP